MPLESGSTIEDFDQSWPLGGDPTNRADDHLRLIKSILKSQFAGSGGNGFSIPITATEDEINHLAGTTGNINTDITDLKDAVSELQVNLSAPTGTKMVFYQAAAPLGWTQDASNNDYMMRVINTTGGGKGGTDSPVSKSFSHSHTTGSHTLTIAEIPAHSHANGYNGVQTGSGGGGPATIGNEQNTASQGGGAAHNHGSTGTFTSTFSPKYLNVIIATKDAP